MARPAAAASEGDECMPKLSDAPILTPTLADMAEFGVFLAKVAAPAAQLYGAVRIDPPDGWAPPPLRMSEKTKFYTRCQRLPALPQPDADGQRRLRQSLVFPSSDRLISLKNFRRRAAKEDAKLFRKLFGEGEEEHEGEREGEGKGPGDADGEEEEEEEEEDAEEEEDTAAVAVETKEKRRSESQRSSGEDGDAGSEEVAGDIHNERNADSRYANPDISTPASQKSPSSPFTDLTDDLDRTGVEASATNQPCQQTVDEKCADSAGSGVLEGIGIEDSQGLGEDIGDETYRGTNCPLAMDVALTNGDSSAALSRRKEVENDRMDCSQTYTGGSVRNMAEEAMPTVVEPIAQELIGNGCASGGKTSCAAEARVGTCAIGEAREKLKSCPDERQCPQEGSSGSCKAHVCTRPTPPVQRVENAQYSTPKRIRRKPERLVPTLEPTQKYRKRTAHRAGASPGPVQGADKGAHDNCVPAAGSGRVKDGDNSSHTNSPLPARSTEVLEEAFWAAMMHGVGRDCESVDLQYGVDVEAEGAYDAHIATYVKGGLGPMRDRRSILEPPSEPSSPSSTQETELAGGVSLPDPLVLQQKGRDDSDGVTLENGIPAHEGSVGRSAHKRGRAWHVGNINNAGILRHLPAMPGINHSMFYVGRLFTRFCWHVEDAFLNSISYLHENSADKIWYVVPPSEADLLEKYSAENVFSESMQEDGKTGRMLLGAKTTLFDPRNVVRFGVSVHRIVHKPGTFVYTSPRAYHGGFNTGFNVAEAVNYASTAWFPYGRTAAECMRVSGLQMPVPLEYLLYRNAYDILDREHDMRLSSGAEMGQQEGSSCQREELSQEASIIAKELAAVIQAGEKAISAVSREVPCRVLEDVRFGASELPPRSAAMQQHLHPPPLPAPRPSAREKIMSLDAMLNSTTRVETQDPPLAIVRHNAELDMTFGSGAGMRCMVCHHLSHFFIAVCDTCPGGGRDARCPRHFLSSNSNVCGTPGHRPLVLRRHSAVEMYDLIGNLERVAGIVHDPRTIAARYTHYTRPWQVAGIRDAPPVSGCFLGPAPSKRPCTGFIFQRCVEISSVGVVERGLKRGKPEGESNMVGQRGSAKKRDRPRKRAHEVPNDSIHGAEGGHCSITPRKGPTAVDREEAVREPKLTLRLTREKGQNKTGTVDVRGNDSTERVAKKVGTADGSVSRGRKRRKKQRHSPGKGHEL